MKNKKILTVALAGMLCLGMASCGNSSDEEDWRVPLVIEDAVYDESASQSYQDELGIWVGVGDTAYDTLTICEADGGMYFEFYQGDDLAACGYAQNLPDYGYVYFFNDEDGKAYQTWPENDGMSIASFGTFTLESPAPNTEGGFEDIADLWFLDGEVRSDSLIVIDENGEWTLYERQEDGDLVEADYGYLRQDPGVEEQYDAHSRRFADVVYDMHMSLSKEAFWWGGEGDAYLRLPAGE